MWLQEVRGQERYRKSPLDQLRDVHRHSWTNSRETYYGVTGTSLCQALSDLPAAVRFAHTAASCGLSQTKMSASRSGRFLLLPKYSLKFFTDFSAAPPLHTVHPGPYQHLGASVPGITNNAWQKLMITSQGPTTGEIIGFWSTRVLTYLCHKCVKALVELSVRWPLLPVDQSEGRGTAYM